MPSTGTPASYSASSIDGASSTCTDAGPPERMIPFGRRASISSKGIVRGTISEYTCASRTRRAISCAYCAPKSTTSTVSNGGASTLALATHADALAALEALALGLQRGGHHDLGLLELLDRLVAGGGHRGAQGAEEVEAAVVLVRRSQEDLAHRASHAGADAGAPRQGGMERGHAPVVAAAGRLVGRRERRSEHHRVGAAGDGLGHVATAAHAPVGDDMAVHAGLVQMADTGPGTVGDGRGLGDADAQHAAAGAGVARSHADQDAHGAGAHQVQGRLVGGAAPDDHRDVELADEALAIERLGGPRDVL